MYHSGPEWTWERWQWRGTPHSPKFLHYWSLVTILFSVISRTLIGANLTPLERCHWGIQQSQSTGRSGLYSYHKMQFSFISRTHIGGGPTPLQRCSRYILQTQQTIYIYTHIFIHTHIESSWKKRMIQLHATLVIDITLKTQGSLRDVQLEHASCEVFSSHIYCIKFCANLLRDWWSCFTKYQQPLGVTWCPL